MSADLLSENPSTGTKVNLEFVFSMLSFVQDNKGNLIVSLNEVQK